MSDSPAERYSNVLAQHSTPPGQPELECRAVDLLAFSDYVFRCPRAQISQYVLMPEEEVSLGIPRYYTHDDRLRRLTALAV
jgi:hypothetical protein